jgi:pyruvate/2-oxoglutarate dehydrogenase complex dihydrolipoamide dehydrogenase (E3) component
MDTEEKLEFGFDRLLIATGVKPAFPISPGRRSRTFSLSSASRMRWLQDPLAHASHVAIIGAGYSALEFAENLHALGKTVTIFEREPHVLSSLDPDMAQIVEFELRRFGVQVSTSANVLALVGHDGRVNGIKSASGLGITPADLVLLDVGVQPNVDLADGVSIQIGTTGGIAVDSHMETNLPGFSQ